MRQDLHFTWDIHYKCNFRCPYCWFFDNWAQQAKRNVYLSPEKWMKHWKNIYDRYGSVRIEITGGEPFLYPNFIQLVKMLSEIHTIKVTTNLSCDIKNFVRELNHEKVNLDLNFHPLFANIDNFIEKALVLQKADFRFGVCYLAYPPQMASIEVVRRRFEEVRIDFALAAFWGEYNDKQYPVAYSEKEKEAMRPYLGNIDRITYHLDGKSPKGKLCNAGYSYANIHADGKVVRCAQYADKPFDDIMGENFSLFSKPLPCEAETCPGNEYDNIC